MSDESVVPLGGARKDGDAAHARTDLRTLATLTEVSQTLAATLDLSVSLPRVLDVVERHHHILRGALSFVDEDAGDVVVRASIGLGPAEQRVRERVGEGLVGRVVATGRPVVVPQASREPLARPWAGGGSLAGGREVSLVSVPLVVEGRSTGALTVALRHRPGRDYERTLKFYGVIASQVAHAVGVSRQVAAESRRLAEENTHLRDELSDRYAFRHLVGTSAAIREVYEQVAQVARTSTTVLLRGESGTGKEMVAHAIHYQSPRASKPFIKVSCAALPESLVESELFGYERGAFTGAQGQKKGRFELADGGTLFLDEIGDLSLSTQVKLLRALQEREIERLGATGSIRVNVRVVAATHQPLEALMAEGRFREDLYYRLNVFTIFLPPLRERKPDVMLLADHFLQKYAAEHGRPIRRISTPAIDMLTSYHWPGNIRELENTIERAALVCEGHVIHAHHLPPTLQTAETSDTVPRVVLSDAVHAFEKDLIQDALKTTRGNAARAARLLSTTERILSYKIRKYSIPAARFRA